MSDDQRTPGTHLSVDALVFDIVGTLVDEVGTLQDATRDAFTAQGLSADQAERFAGEWLDRFDAVAEAVARGDDAYAPADELRRRLLDDLLDESSVELPAETVEQLTGAASRLRPWSDTADQLSTLAALRPTIGLTNATPAQALEISARAGLRWHTLLCSHLAGTFKPDPAAYRLPVDLLGLTPERTLFIAAHPWDLRAAAAAGYQTAYLPRRHADRPEPTDRFTITLSGLRDLVPALDGASGTR